MSFYLYCFVSIFFSFNIYCFCIFYSLCFASTFSVSIFIPLLLYFLQFVFCVQYRFQFPFLLFYFSSLYFESNLIFSFHLYCFIFYSLCFNCFQYHFHFPYLLFYFCIFYHLCFVFNTISSFHFYFVFFVDCKAISSSFNTIRLQIHYISCVSNRILWFINFDMNSTMLSLHLSCLSINSSGSKHDILVVLR